MMVCNAPSFLMISEENNMATIIIATICILIELYHLIFRSDMELTKSIIENTFNELKKVDVDDHDIINEILSNVSMKTIYKYFAIAIIEILYWAFAVTFIFLLPHGLGIIVFGLLLGLNLIIQYMNVLDEKHINLYHAIDSIICIAMYIVILLTPTLR